MDMKLLVIVWYGYSRRAETLAAEFRGQVSFLYEKDLTGRWLAPLRYLLQGLKTWRLLERERPEVVIVQTPPIFAALIVAAWCKIRGGTGRSGQRVSYVLDCHTGTFYDPRWRWALPLLRLLARQAAVTLVASEAALGILQDWRARGLFLMDGLPSLSPPTGTVGYEGESRIAVIGSFAADEPVVEMFAAARLLPEVRFYFSGNPGRMTAGQLARKPENVVLTGFLSDSAYSGLLRNVHGLVVLTKDPNVLNCGAYEALAVGKPVVVSDWPQMRRRFTCGFIFVNNTPEAIASGVKKMLSEQTSLVDKIITMRSELIASRQPVFQDIVDLLAGGSPPPPPGVLVDVAER